MTKIAIVYHSGYGHTHAVAESIAEGVRAAGADANLLRIEGPTQDFQPLLDAVSAADGVIFGSPTYMGDTSAAFRAFAEASAKIWFTLGWRDKIAAGFTNSQSFSGDKLHALQSLAVLAAQHGMIWVNQGEPVPTIPASERNHETVNRVGASTGLMTQSDNAAPDVAPPAGDHETARRFGRRVAEAARRWNSGSA
jgi:NAD(P)H dehydrogenase (quinone)